MSRLTVQRIFQESFGEYERTHSLPKHALHAARRIRKCRTGELGLHRHACPNGHYTETAPNSCRHRSCPQCRYLGVTRWIEGASRRIFSCPHFHVIFTVAHELNPLWKQGSRVMTRIFFASVKETLFEFLKDRRRLGVLPGIIASLQTWGGSLYFHPHIHCLVTAGGIMLDGTWRAAGNFLFPAKAASKYFRRVFLDAVERAVSSGELTLPSELSSWPKVLRKIRAKKWNVYVQSRISNPEHVVNYLGRYIRGGPIGNSRLVAITESTVTFRHMKGRNDKPMTLDRAEFIGRLLRHVPIPGLQLVRSYGLYANNHPAVLAFPTREEEADIANTTPKKSAATPCCPTCGATLIFTVFRRSEIEDFKDSGCRGSPKGGINDVAA
ncbi:MAG: transposase [Acidobacteriota bacterium]